MIWTRFLVPFESTLHSDDVYYSALLYCMQAIKAGITGFAESGGRFMERTIQAAVETGMRAAVARSMMDSGREITPQMLETKEEALDRNDALYEAYQGAGDGRIQVYYGMRQVMTCTPAFMEAIAEHANARHIAPHLYRLLYALERPVRFIICDGDIVEEKNLVRQNFTPADLGENKAKVLAERYSSVFGMETEYVPEFIESGERLLSMLRARTFPTGPYWHSQTVKELVILIGAVDNNKSRKLCHEVFYKLDDLIYIDSGNGMHTGQIVCGIRSGGRTIYRPVGAAFPEVLQDTDKFPTELSCAEASVSAPQSIAANITAATAVVDMIYNILTVGETRVRQITFATGSVNMRATLQKTRRKAA